jgi:hypothetical protein
MPGARASRALAAINDAGAEQLGPRSQQGGHVLRSATGGSAVMKFSLRPAIFLTIYKSRSGDRSRFGRGLPRPQSTTEVPAQRLRGVVVTLAAKMV